MTAPIIRAFFDEPTNTVSYLVADPVTGDAAVIDPVLDFDLPSGEVDTRSAAAILAAARLPIPMQWSRDSMRFCRSTSLFLDVRRGQRPLLMR